MKQQDQIIICIDKKQFNAKQNTERHRNAMLKSYINDKTTAKWIDNACAIRIQQDS